MLLSRPFRTTAGVLVVVYLVTMAPGLTLWDAGEFQSAVATLGIPHPPGAPLYVLLARTWSFLWPASGFTLAMNALSAVATALMGGSVAWLFARWMRSNSAGIATGIAAGLVYSVWQNATETEVYALSLLLGVLMLVIGELAGETGDRRMEALLAYVLGLAGSLHLDALLAAPAAALLAVSTHGERGLQLRPLTRWVGPGILALGLGRASLTLVILAVVCSAADALLPLPGARSERARASAYMLLLVALGASSALFMLVRAAHDPGINQGDPSVWSRFVAVIARDQYAVTGLWPRRAPLWLQMGNVVQYFDWQFAFGLDGRTTFSFYRAPFTTLFVALAWVGARAHWTRDSRTARAWLMYILVGSFGALLVLNLQAGPSIGWGILPADAGHEARDRDYFFVVAFVGVAAWAAIGMHEMVRLRAARAVRYVPVVLAVLMIGGNLSATNRRREPDASVPRRLASALLTSAPADAVLLMAGDNDSYAVWHAQQVHGQRPDVVPVTLPLLGAGWYRQELRRRYGLLDAEFADKWHGTEATLSEIKAGAFLNRRPFAAAASVEAETRNGLAPSWILRGLVYVADSSTTVPTPSIDSLTVEIARELAEGESPRIGRDPTTRYVQRLLHCPALAISSARDSSAQGSLDSVCNFR